MPQRAGDQRTDILKIIVLRQKLFDPTAERLMTIFSTTPLQSYRLKV